MKENSKVNRLDRIRTIYAIEFEDGSIGYFEACEMKKGNKGILGFESEIVEN